MPTVNVSDCVAGEVKRLCHVQFPLLTSEKDCAGRVVVRREVERTMGVDGCVGRHPASGISGFDSWFGGVWAGLVGDLNVNFLQKDDGERAMT